MWRREGKCKADVSILEKSSFKQVDQDKLTASHYPIHIFHWFGCLKGIQLADLDLDLLWQEWHCLLFWYLQTSVKWDNVLSMLSPNSWPFSLGNYYYIILVLELEIFFSLWISFQCCDSQIFPTLLLGNTSSANGGKDEAIDSLQWCKWGRDKTQEPLSPGIKNLEMDIASKAQSGEY